MSSREELENNKQKIKEISGRENIIPGIHNYCDRWCERCAFVSRCTVGISEFEIEGPDLDMKNKEFWDHLSMVFQASREMIAEGARDLVIDLDLDAEKTEYIEPVQSKSAVEKRAEEYGFRLLPWLKINQDLFIQKAEAFSLINEQQLVSFQDAIDVIRWYSLFIAVKIHRASLPAMDFADEEADRGDKNGSAKIALLAVNRSLEAFSFLYTHVQEQEDEILEFLADLSHIQKQLNKAFPDAMNFKRPGFDD